MLINFSKALQDIEQHRRERDKEITKEYVSIASLVCPLHGNVSPIYMIQKL